MLPPSMHMPVVMRLERSDSCVTCTSIFSNCVGMFICSFLRNAHLLFCMNLIFWKALKVLGSIPAKTQRCWAFSRNSGGLLRDASQPAVACAFRRPASAGVSVIQSDRGKQFEHSE